MKKKAYRSPVVVGSPNVEMIVPLAAAIAAVGPAVSAAAASVGAAAASVGAAASTAATIGLPLAGGYAVGRIVKSMEIRPDVPQVPALKKVYC